MSKQLSIRSEDALKGAQLTAQYHRATGGMKEVLIFGAMMMQLRELHPELAQKGPVPKSKSTRGLTPEPPPLTMAEWLAAHAPEVKRPTALRFLAVTQSVAIDYAQIVGTKAAKAMPLPELVTTPAKHLDELMQGKQLELFEWVNGTSQKSWLDKFMPRKLNHPPKPTKASAAKRNANRNDETLTAAQLMETAKEQTDALHDMHTGEAWKSLDTDDLADLDNKLSAYHTDVMAELKQRRRAR